MRIDISRFLYDLFHDRDRQILENPHLGEKCMAPLQGGGGAWLSFSSIDSVSSLLEVWPCRLSAVKGAGRFLALPIMRIRTDKKPMVNGGVITSIGTVKVEFFGNNEGDNSFEFGTELGEQVGKMMLYAGQMARHKPESVSDYNLPSLNESHSVKAESSVLQAAA